MIKFSFGRNGASQINRKPKVETFLFWAVVGVCFAQLYGQNSAVSSHYNFYPSPLGDITIVEVRVPAAGVATSTYYESLGFWGNKGNSTGNGYGGIQESGDSRGNKVHIFSIWHSMDSDQVKDTAGYPYAAHLAYGMMSETFGGEGVGRKTWCLTKDPNHPLYWKPDVWYTHLVRAWNVGNDTHYGFFVRDGQSGVWRHLSTIGVHEPNIRIQGANDSFIEDWSSTGSVRRETNIRNLWRRATNGSWQAAQYGNYSVNDWDLDPGKRSYNYRTNWNGGVASDATGQYYFMVTGGEGTAPTPPLNYPNKLSNRYDLANSASKPAYPAGKLLSLSLKELNGQKLEVSWVVDSLALPQFGTTIELFDNPEFSGAPLLSSVRTVPQLRRDTLSISTLHPTTQQYHLRLRMNDLFDQASPYLTATFGEKPLSSEEGSSEMSSSSTDESSSSEEGTAIALEHGLPLQLLNGDRSGVALALPGSGRYTLRLFSLTGRLVEAVSLESEGAIHHHRWKTPLAGGLYLIELQHGAHRQTIGKLRAE